MRRAALKETTFEVTNQWWGMYTVYLTVLWCMRVSDLTTHQYKTKMEIKTFHHLFYNETVVEVRHWGWCWLDGLNDLCAYICNTATTCLLYRNLPGVVLPWKPVKTVLSMSLFHPPVCECESNRGCVSTSHKLLLPPFLLAGLLVCDDGWEVEVRGESDAEGVVVVTASPCFSIRAP